MTLRTEMAVDSLPIMTVCTEIDNYVASPTYDGRTEIAM